MQDNENLVELDNHHNAAKCPHCTDNGRLVMVEATTIETQARESEEMQRLAKEEGVSETLALIDRLTGGDGEYRYCMGGGEGHCPDEGSMQAKIVERYEDQAREIAELRGWEATLRYCEKQWQDERAVMISQRDQARAEAERLTDAQRFTLSDSQRLLRKCDVEGICQSPDLCWEYGDTARCGPCAIKQAEALGVTPNHGLPNLPEVYRQQRANEALRTQLTETQARLAEAVGLIRSHAKHDHQCLLNMRIGGVCECDFRNVRAFLSKQEGKP